MHYIVAVIAGSMAILAYAPFNIYPLAILSTSCLLYLWHNASPKHALISGFCYGLGLFGSGVYWVFISMHDYGNMSISLSLILTSLFIGYLAIFPSIHGYILQRWWPQNNSTKLIAAFPATWVIMEWLRGWLFTGFPWLHIGYSQVSSSLQGFAPIISIYGVSLVTSLSGGLLVYAWLNWLARKKFALFWTICGFLLCWSSGSILSKLQWTKNCSTPIKVSLVQANIPQEIKWDEAYLYSTISTYIHLTEPLWDHDLIVWPEAAIPLAANDIEPLLKYLTYHAKQHHTTLITGIPVRNKHHEYYNAVIAIGETHGKYFKKHLVPFGEYIPCKKWLGSLFNFIKIPVPNLLSNAAVTDKPFLVAAKNFALQTFICYEIAFPEQVLTQSRSSNILLTVTNDAWFGRSIAAAQHLQMAQMRSLETGKPGIFASNNGITALIDSHGNLHTTAPALAQYVLTGTIQGTCGVTPWQQYGMKTLWWILGIMLSLSYYQQKIRKTHERSISSIRN